MTNSSALLEKETAGAARSEPLRTGSPFNMRTCQNTASRQEHSGTDTLLEGTLTGAPSREKLSKRETQILELILAGHTNREIAQKIYRTERTVEYHRNRLMRKLDTHTPVELVKRAMAMGLA